MKCVCVCVCVCVCLPLFCTHMSVSDISRLRLLSAPPPPPPPPPYPSTWNRRDTHPSERVSTGTRHVGRPWCTCTYVYRSSAWEQCCSGFKWVTCKETEGTFKFRLYFDYTARCAQTLHIHVRTYVCMYAQYAYVCHTTTSNHSTLHHITSHYITVTVHHTLLPWGTQMHHS